MVKKLFHIKISLKSQKHKKTENVVAKQIIIKILCDLIMYTYYVFYKLCVQSYIDTR